MPLARDTDLTGGRLRGLAGGLTPIPLRGTGYSFNGPSAPSYASDGRDPVGAGRSIALAATAGATGIVGFRDRLYGRTVGLRIDRSSVVGPFDVVIDGRVYRIDSPQSYWQNIPTLALSDTYGIIIVDDDLTLGYHQVDVYVSVNPDGATTNTVRILGWVGDQNSGYITEQRRYNHLPSVVAVTTTWANLSFNATGVPPTEFRFANITSAPHVLYLRDATPNVMETIVLPPGAKYSFKLGNNVFPDFVQASADANSAITYKVVYA